MRLPALWVAREGSFEVAEEPVTACSWVAYRNGFFRGLRFLDSAGDSWQVKEAVPKRAPRLLDKLLNRQIEMDVQLSGPERRPISDVAEELCACVDRDPGDVYCQFVGHDELKRLFRSASSVDELLEHARRLGQTPKSR